VPSVHNTVSKATTPVDIALVTRRKADGMAASVQTSLADEDIVRAHIGLPPTVEATAELEPVMVAKADVPADLGQPGGRQYKIDAGTKAFTGLAKAEITTPAITGVQAMHGDPGTPAGNGTLAFVAADKTLAWAPAGGTAGTAVDVSAGGQFTLPGGAVDQALIVFVDAGVLPAADAIDTVVVS